MEVKIYRNKTETKNSFLHEKVEAFVIIYPEQQIVAQTWPRSEGWVVYRFLKYDFEMPIVDYIETLQYEESCALEMLVVAGISVDQVLVLAKTLRPGQEKMLEKE